MASPQDAARFNKLLWQANTLILSITDFTLQVLGCPFDFFENQWTSWLFYYSSITSNWSKQFLLRILSAKDSCQRKPFYLFGFLFRDDDAVISKVYDFLHTWYIFFKRTLSMFMSTAFLQTPTWKPLRNWPTLCLISTLTSFSFTMSL